MIHSQPDWIGGDIPAAGTVKCWLGVGAPGDEGEGGWTGGKEWSVLLIAQGDDPISEYIAGALPEGHLGGILHLMSSWETRYLTFSQTLPHSVCGFQLGPHTSSLSGSSVTMASQLPLWPCSVYSPSNNLYCDEHTIVWLPQLLPLSWQWLPLFCSWRDVQQFVSCFFRHLNSILRSTPCCKQW